MSKRLCKLNRRDIAEQLGDIQRLVSTPKFLCHSCARVSQDKSMLCKPMALQSEVDALDQPVKQQEAVIAAPKPNSVMLDEEATLLSKSQVKQAKKQAKQQKKYLKKLKKTVEKQAKLLRKQRKLETQFHRANLSLNQLPISSAHTVNQKAMH